jgi:hypothetical protein
VAVSAINGGVLLLGWVAFIVAALLWQERHPARDHKENRWYADD